MTLKRAKAALKTACICYVVELDTFFSVAFLAGLFSLFLSPIR
jgi:hypothetical protein